MRSRFGLCILVLAAILLVTVKATPSFSAPFSSCREYRAMQRHLTKKYQAKRLKALEIYFTRKNPKVSQKKISRYANLIDQYSSQYGLDPFLVAGVMMKESTVKENAVSKGNYGLMQINWNANRPWIVKTFPIKTKKQLMVPENNIRVGVHILAANIKKSKGSVDKGLDRYRGRSLASYRNSVHAHYLAIARIFKKL